MTDLERLAEACEQAADLVCNLTECEEMTECSSCIATMRDIVEPLRALSVAIRAGRVSVTEEEA